jgi:uncharacterized protein YdbL (DUF1318 family)
MNQTRTIREYMNGLTAEDAAIYARVVERADGYLPMISADAADYQIALELVAYGIRGEVVQS